MRKYLLAALAVFLSVALATAQTIAPGGVPLPNVLPHPGYIVNDWYVSLHGGVASTGAAMPANTIVCSYDPVAQAITIGNLAVNVTTTDAVNSMQLAIYSNANGRPATLLASTGNISLAAATTVTIVTSPASVQIGPGSASGKDTWFCSNNNSGTAAVTSKTNTSSNGPARVGAATASAAVGNPAAIMGVSCSGANCTGGSSTFNTWPASLAGSTWTDNGTNQIPRIGFRVTSVP